jgi:hypothetical protein
MSNCVFVGYDSNRVFSHDVKPNHTIGIVCHKEVGLPNREVISTGVLSRKRLHFPPERSSCYNRFPGYPDRMGASFFVETSRVTDARP